MSLDAPEGREVATPVEIKFTQLVEEANGDPKKRSAFYKKVIAVSRHDPRENQVLRERMVRHFYHVYGNKPVVIAEKTGMAKAYVSSKLASIRNTNLTAAELDAVKEAIGTVERDFTADGVSGILGKLDQLATLSYMELMRRLIKEPELFENRDLVYLFRSILEQFNAMVDRIRTADPNSAAKFLTTEDARNQVAEGAELLEGLEPPPDALKVVEGKGK